VLLIRSKTALAFHFIPICYNFDQAFPHQDFTARDFFFIFSSKKTVMATNTVKLHRVIKASPEKVYRAFTKADALASWLPPYGFLCKVQAFDPRVGGGYKMSFTNFTTGNGHSFGGKYLEMKPNEFLKYTDKFDSPDLPGEMTNTVVFKKVSVGTELHVTQEGIPEMIPVEMCYLGWQESLEKLIKLVEPEIKDA
jgi:uncharacterized protein YndB with AHSA1/START domain